MNTGQTAHTQRSEQLPKPKRKYTPRPLVAPGEYVALRKAVIAKRLGVDTSEMLTSQEVATLLGVTAVTIQRYTREGLLKKYGKGKGRSFYLRSEIETIAQEAERYR